MQKVNNTQTVGETPLSYCHLYIGENKDRVVYLNYRLELTRTEYKILRLLAESVGTPLSADRIALLLGRSSNAKNIVYHISSINRKARSIGGRTLIKNSAKIGYFLNEEM